MADPSRHARQQGSVSVLALGLLIAIVTLAIALAAVGRVLVERAELQQAVDVAARSLTGSGGDTSQVAVRVARSNGADDAKVVAVATGQRVEALRRVQGPLGIGTITLRARSATVEVRRSGSAKEYRGPLERVDFARVCPAVAADYRALERTAAAAGITLTAVSGYRSVAEQAVLYAKLGPRIAAPPGRSLHHAATELDIVVGLAGSPIHRFLLANGPRYNFIQRYSWEPWHWGNVRGC